MRILFGSGLLILIGEGSGAWLLRSNACTKGLLPAFSCSNWFAPALLLIGPAAGAD